ncbi:3-hydroxy-3-isohexenylglutaryl-CoA/hydroxy-methylglutaryl-CoA lyase [Thalassocella blandensis]|nr:3-hydroxy-3-isohexenylglutaryl-CoA/hydroxy-methylglutaryl-CoA lyase [Thalassocella blandensis]
MSTQSQVKIVEVGPRDGLQNETKVLSPEQKFELIERLYRSGLRSIEVGSLVNPARVPQMANSDALYKALDSSDFFSGQQSFPVLVPNIKGMERAIELGVKEIACFTAASDTFNEKNIGCDIEESFTRIAAVMELARQHHIAVRGYLSCIVSCPYEGAISQAKVAQLTERLLDLGCYEISLGDTIGVATPGQISPLLEQILRKTASDKLALHLHDTYGQALANISVGLAMGIRSFDSSIAGLGGCPYAPGASGNVATEDLVYMLHGMGFHTHVDLTELVETGSHISNLLGRQNNSKVGLALLSQNRRTESGVGVGSCK